MEEPQPPTSPDLDDLLIVSPPPLHSNLQTPKSALTPTISPPPPNSANILSAILQVERTLNAEIGVVNLLASAGRTSTTQEKHTEGGDAADFTSPESDCVNSPVPPVFPPMMGGAACFSPMRAHSPMRSTPAAGKKLATLEEGRDTDDTAGGNAGKYESSDGVEIVSPDNNKGKVEENVEAEQTKTGRQSTSSIDSDLFMVSPPPLNLQTPTTTHTPTKSPPPPNSENILSAIRQVEQTLNVEIHNVNLLASAGGTTSKSRRRVDEESDFTSPESDCVNSPVPPTFPPMMMGGDDDAFHSSSSLAARTHSPPSRRHTIATPMARTGQTPEMNTTEMDYSSLGKTPKTSASPLHSKSLLPFLTTLEEEHNHSTDDSGEVSAGFGGDESPEKSVSDGMDEDAIDFSKLNLNDDDGSSSGESVSCHGSVSGEDGESVQQPDDKPSKAIRRRIIDDDSDESTVNDGTNNDEGSPASHKSTSNAEPLDADLDGGFSGLTLDECSSFGDGSECSSFGGGDDDSIRAASTINDEASDSFLSVTSGKSNEEAGDDDSVVCFDACGCWAPDEVHKGDLYLSDNSDVKWPKIRLPLALYNKLFKHQRIGIQWMASLYKNEIKGGILADDMGLGKTMQTLSYLGGLMRAQTISNTIVVCPKSVVRSWEREANLILKNMCVPNASVYAITSDMSKEKRKRQFTDAFTCSAKAPRLVVTTYGLVSNHITDLNSIASAFQDNHWCYVILDEGHLIKNRKTKTSQDVRLLSRSQKTRRVLLTGTPIQNNMQELYALFDWASPTLLGSIQTFMNQYGNIIEEGRQRNASDWTVKKAGEMNIKLTKLLQPYFLQRLKETAFDNQLPEKKELVVFTQLSAKQRRMYEDYSASVLDGDMPSSLAAVSYLKMLCGHPSLVKEAAGRYKHCDAGVLARDSAKLQVLLALLNRLKRSGHRSLVFSQSTKMLDIIEKAFDGSFSYLRIDGSSAERSRQKCVDSFNDHDSGIDVMLLSTKAAGIGLTLTGADRAILYDPSWNPAEDAQAVDRCYRIGQDKNVTVYRFIAAGTVEEKMYEKQVHKDGIKKMVLSAKGAEMERYFDTAELADLFKLSPIGECSMMEKFNERMHNNAAGSSGKPSFLTKHPQVVGVASHDVLYAGISAVDVDLTSPQSQSEDTPFSRLPYQKSKKVGKKAQSVPVEDLTLDNTPMKPLGGLNKTRQNREEAKKAKRNQENAMKSQSSVVNILSDADAFVADQHHGKAMGVLLDLVEKDFDSMKGDEKLAVHEKISYVALSLGWLS